jgi:hypothetical protein
MMGKKQTYAINMLLAAALLLAACGSRQSDASPTPNVTQAYQTVEARLTELAAKTPPASPTPAPTNTPPATPTLPPPTATNTTAPTNTSAVVVNSCDIAAAGNPIDVTIPDGTQMAPGQNFTKTWRLQNAGTCTWTTSYSVAYFSGEAMSATQNIPFPNEVAPGQSVNISVDMIAPLNPGTYQGNWKLRNASNTYFGIGSVGTPFWVSITVVGSLTAGPSPTAGTTITPGSGGVVASGTRNIAPNTNFDLDGGLAGSKNDLTYSADQANNAYFLVPRNNATLGLFGASEPTKADCEAMSKSGAQFSLVGQSSAYLCYQTDLGLIGWLYLEFFNINNLEITVTIKTFAP